jgi:hypothetical protein
MRLRGGNRPGATAKIPTWADEDTVVVGRDDTETIRVVRDLSKGVAP